MSWWTHFRDSAVKYSTFGIVDPEKSRHAEAEQRYAMQAQVQSYKDQTELTRQEIATKKGEEAVEKRRVEEKQIRSLRRNYSARGFLGSGQAPDNSQPGMSDKLGG